MSGQKFLIPREGLIVRNPVDFTPLPETGALVDWNTFWRRRVACGDASIGEPEPVLNEPKRTSKRSR